MKDPEFEEYCRQVESLFYRFKRRPGSVVGDEFRRVKSWYEEGIPLTAVREGIRAAFHAMERGRDRGIEEVNSLAFCERFVRSALPRGKE